MRIVNKKEFYELPVGTIFSRFVPSCINGLMIKDRTIRHENGEGFDFCYQDLIGNLESDNSDEFFEMLDSAQKDSSLEMPMDFDVIERDGEYVDEDLYAVYSKKDVSDLIERLKKTLE